MIDQLHHLSSERLAPALAVDPLPSQAWTTDDLRAMLAHQLQARLIVDLGSDALASTTDVVQSFGDLFQSSDPPLALLRLVHRFAKSHLHDPADLLPREISTVLYYAAIMAASLHGGVRLSSLGDDELRQGADWVLAQPWVDGVIRELAERYGDV